MKKTKPYIDIQGRLIGEDYPPLVIAEIGINHAGSIETAIKMAESAINSGVEMIKHQTHIVEDEMSHMAKQVIPGNSDLSIFEIMQSCALGEEDELTLKDYVESKGCIFISTPFSRAAADRLQKFNVSAYKIGSGECNNYPLVEYISKFGKPMIISTGMNNIKSISKTVSILKQNRTPYALLHTTNLYPTPSNLVRLGALNELIHSFPDAVVGLSDHTTSNLACYSATALGASILERHYTDSMKREGPDIVNSMDPESLKELIINSREIFLMRGGKKEAAVEEQVTIDFAFATVVSIKNIRKGEKFTHDNIWVKRPGAGEIQAEFLPNVIGKTASKDIDNDTHIEWSMVSD